MHTHDSDRPSLAVTSDQTFRIELARTGGVYDVPPDSSILDVLLAAGVFVPFSCREGICGTCIVKVLEGAPAHLDDFLSDEEKAENSCLAACCSRARSPKLTLDI